MSDKYLTPLIMKKLYCNNKLSESSIEHFIENLENKVLTTEMHF